MRSANKLLVACLSILAIATSNISFGAAGQYPSFIGPTGVSGRTGSTGATGASGQTGTTGIGVDTPIALNSVGNTGTTETLNFASQTPQSITLDNNCTLSFTGATTGGSYLIKIIQDATGSRLITWPAAVKWPSGTAPTLSTGANKVDIVTLFFDGTDYFGNAGLDYR